MALQFPASGANRLDDAAIVGGPAINGNISISYWLNAVSMATVQSIYGVYTATIGTAGIQMGIRNTALCIWVWGGGILVQGTTNTTGAWIHCVYTYNGTTHRLYVNGVEEANSAATPQTGNVLVIQFNSYAGGGASEVFAGLIADARLYNRTLSAAEVQTIFACRGTDGITSGLFSRYLFNELSPGTAVSSANTKDVSGTQQGLLTLTGSGFAFGTDQLRFRRRVA
jgi:hypothetical protein